jgi:hypothetical protein
LTDNKPSVFNFIEKTIIPNTCEPPCQNGVCYNEKCLCAQDFMGQDCSIGKSELKLSNEAIKGQAELGICSSSSNSKCYLSNFAYLFLILFMWCNFLQKPRV